MRTADRRTDILKLIVVFRNFAYAPKERISIKCCIEGACEVSLLLTSVSSVVSCSSYRVSTQRKMWLLFTARCYAETPHFAHTVYLRVAYDVYNKQPLYPYIAFTGWSF